MTPLLLSRLLDTGYEAISIGNLGVGFEVDSELSALTFGALDGYFSTHLFNNGFADAELQAQSFLIQTSFFS